MKIRKTFICTALIVLFVAPTTLAQWKNKKVKGNGTVTTKTVATGTYDIVKAVGPMDFVLERGAEGSITVIADDNLHEYIVIETDDAILVAPRDRAQSVKAVVQRLRAGRREESRAHSRVYRPWGFYETIARGDRFQAKRICVKPGQKLSLQMHHHRAEHWVVVRGTALVSCDEREFLLSENESTYIPLGNVHRLENPGKVHL